MEPKLRIPSPFFPQERSSRATGGPSGLLGEYEDIAVEKQQLHSKNLRYAQTFKRLADSGKSGHPHQDKCRPDREHGAGQDGGEGYPAAGDPQRTDLEEYLPVKNRVEYSYCQDKRADQGDFSEDEKGGQT